MWTFGLATTGQVVIFAGQSGNAAFGVYGIVEGPYFLVCAGLIGVREIDFTRAAEPRYSMSNRKASRIEQFIQS